MGEFMTIVFFFIMSWGLGYTLTRFMKSASNFYERQIMRLGIGMGTVPILGILLNTLHIPLHWLAFLILSLAWPAYDYVIRKKNVTLPSLKLTKSNLMIFLLILMFASLFFVMHKGSFVYPWLEDGDPYQHTVSTNYIATQHTYSKPDLLYIEHYTYPYPQGFPIFTGLLRQTNDSVAWTLKFFNALWVALSIPFFFFFAKRFLKDEKKAMFATFALAAIPCFQSHFIFAETLALMLFFPALYCLTMIDEDRNWTYPSIVVIASIMVTQQLSAFIFGLFFASYWIVRMALDRRFHKYIFIAGALGLLLSIALFFGSTFYEYSSGTLGEQYTVGTDELHKSFFDFADTASVRYLALSDFINPCISDSKGLIRKCGPYYPNKTDNPTGIGIVLFLVFLASAGYLVAGKKKILSEEHPYILVTLAWLIITFTMVMGDRLPFKILPNRCWAFFAIPVVLLSSLGLDFIQKMAPRLSINRTIILAILIIGILSTSALPKYRVNTSMWMPHAFNSMDEAEGYLWMQQNLPANTYVFNFCSGDGVVMASDMMSPVWDNDLYRYRYEVNDSYMNWDSHIFANVTDMNKSRMMTAKPAAFSGWLKGKGFEYIAISSKCAELFGGEETEERVQDLSKSMHFRPVKSAQGVIIMKVI